MFINVELEVNHKLLRGDVRLPEGTGPFPVVCFLSWLLRGSDWPDASS